MLRYRAACDMTVSVCVCVCLYDCVYIYIYDCVCVFVYRVPYSRIFGGVTAFTRAQFMRVNGFSNQYYGWGGEDDDMYSRSVLHCTGISL